MPRRAENYKWPLARYSPPPFRINRLNLHGDVWSRIVSTINFDEKRKKEKKKSGIAGETREFVYVYYTLNWNSSSVENLHSPARWWGRGRRFQRLGAELSELKI